MAVSLHGGTNNVFAWWNKFSFYFNFNFARNITPLTSNQFRERDNKKGSTVRLKIDNMQNSRWLIIIVNACSAPLNTL